MQTAPSDTAAILIEPVIGEGGYVAAPTSFLQGLREVCDKHGILLIFDEVQSGFGRTGKYFATEHSGVRPDMITIAKVLLNIIEIAIPDLTTLQGIANGFPLSGVVTRKELTDQLKPGSLVSDYTLYQVKVAQRILSRVVPMPEMRCLVLQALLVPRS